MGRTVLQAIAWKCALALAAVGLLAAPAPAADIRERLLHDARDGRLDEFDFLTAALIAGGVEDECELSGWLDMYTQRRSQLLQSVPAKPPILRLEAIHDALHDRLLTGNYDVAASDLRTTLSNGDFNCLSSLALYFDMCEAEATQLEIRLTRGHVFLRGAIGEQTVVLEPGTPDWAAGRSIERHRSRQLTPVELLAKFYYNRGVELLKAGQFADGIELLQISLTLDSEDRDARANLVAGLNNWAVELLLARRYDDAAALIEQGLLMDPSFAPLVVNEQLVRAKLNE